MRINVLGEVEQKFADIIWNMEPVSTSTLVRESEKRLGWKKSTTYTVLKRLSAKGIFQNQNGTVVALIKKDEYLSRQCDSFVDEMFQGSLPLFVATFASRKKLTEREIDEIIKIIKEN